MPLYPLAVEVTPAGSDRQVQYNDNGAFGADAGFSYESNGVFTFGTAATGFSVVGANGTVGNPSPGNGNLSGGSAFDDGMSTPANGAGFDFQGGQSANGGSGGTLYFEGGFSDSGQGGDVEFAAGYTNTGTRGNIKLNDLPTSDPGIPGAVWANSNVLQVSP